MTTNVDARGLACPQPVIQTRRAMQESDHVVTLVDNESAATNVQRMAQGAGWEARVTREDACLVVEMTRREAAGQAVPDVMAKAEPSAGPLVLVVTGEGIGIGDPELAETLMRSFFDTLTSVLPRPGSILLLNAGVKLACQGSPVLEDLCALEDLGVTILACRTCLRFFGIEEQLAAGRISNMLEIAEAMFRAGKVVNL